MHLIKRCLDADPLNRPTAKEIYEILDPSQLSYDTELQRQIEKADEINNKLLTENTQTSLELSYETHLEAVYTKSLRRNYSQLSIMRMSLQINISQLNINENESLQLNISQLNINENSQNNESEGKRKKIRLD
ncbi:hypothetical protein RhiirC2_781224 [Rhizophagus irregularis]|uniref:Protein kinase domain-containing protein n=1 Tax=Rhizophagus irregularis TaxID=588596 RepID=A0A2N1N5T7_9GLOM|nr:hypothetical protein RhiirC2_781224 [Rhizophagus irregularis]